jgi:atypical dual specificity phosphatase
MSSSDGDYIIVEEKIDGANLGLRLGEDGYTIIAQNRSHIVHSKSHEQFKKLDKWVLDNTKVLRRVLRDQNLILYGEWVYALHSTSYDHLPGYFVAFDLRCVLTDTWASRRELECMLQGTDISLTPLLLTKPSAPSSREAKALLDQILKQVERKSSFATDFQAEGVYVRMQRNLWTLDRGKIVRGNFICGNKRWNRDAITVNELSTEAQKRAESKLAEGAEGAEADEDAATVEEATPLEEPPQPVQPTRPIDPQDLP